MIRITILTQEENLYLPSSFAHVCRELGDRVKLIISAPAMSTHGGPIKGFFRHASLFGLYGTWILGSRTIAAKLRARTARPTREGPYYSIQHVAESFDIPFHRVAKIKSEEFETLVDSFPTDILISISCPQIIGKKVRDRFPKGCINVHGAPLPKYRGLMPAFWMLKNDEKAGAATVHVLDAKLDDGDVLLQEPIEISGDDTWDSMVRKTKKAGADALVRAVKMIEDGTVTYTPNREEDATYFSFPTGKDRKEFRSVGRRFF